MKTEKLVFSYVCAMLCCLAFARPAAAEGPATPGVAGLHVAANPATGMIFEVQKGEVSIVAKRIENAASGYNWVAPNSNMGPCLLQETNAWPAAAKPDDWKLATADIRAGKPGVDSVTARWLRKDGLELRWTARRPEGEDVWEFQSELQNTGATPIPKVKELGPLRVRLAANPADLAVHYVARRNYLDRKCTVPIPPQGIAISGGEGNSPSGAPGWIAIENSKAREILFLGVEWESYWTVRLTPQPKGGVLLQCILDTQDHDLAPKASLASPRVFLGLSHGDIDDSLRILHDHLRRIMPPVPTDFPWVTYDIWGTEAKGVEEAILAEIPFAAKLGVEVFYIDAGWYEGSCKDGSGDWMTGVGNYAKEDRVKYPGGLAMISKKVHAAGMKFGLWFGPRVVDSRLVGTVIPPDFVARRDGKDITLHYSYWTPITQICPGNPKVVEHLKKMIGNAVERYDLDWVKYDNSGVTNVCNRTDHGHQATDGALAALQGQYEIWKYLHQRFPKLMLEDWGVDYGLARMATSHFAPGDLASAAGARRSEIDASYVFPAAHLGAFVVVDKGAKDPAALDAVIRSRMMVGTWTFATLYGKLSDRVSLFPANLKAALKRNIRVYKQYRHLLREDVYHLLPSSTRPQEWDAIEFCKRDGSEAVVLAFRSQSPEVEKVLPLRGLLADAAYDVRNFDSGQVRVVTGKELAGGLKVSLPTADTSEILHITPASPAGRNTGR